jgi:hypothetical protein
MLRKYIESRERHFYGRDRSRRSLPFAWGTDLLGIQPDSLHEFAADALNNSDKFFSYQPTSDYRLDGEVLTFPSAAQTGYEENNTVWGRVFQASGDQAVIVLPQWNCDWDGHVKLCRILQQRGITSLRLSMPYHHFRKPPHLERPEYIVSPNVGQTIQSVRQAVVDARRAADWLQSRGYTRLTILGTSLGSCVAFLTFAHDTRFTSGIFIHVSAYFGDVVWNGLSTSHVRRSLDGHIQEDALRNIWAPISPLPYIKRLQAANRRILMFAGRYDPTFLPHLSQQAFDEFDRYNIPYRLHWLPCGHYTIGRFPFNAMLVHRIVRFFAPS